MTDAQRLVGLLLDTISPKEFLKPPEIAKSARPSMDEVRFKLYMEPEDMFELEGSFTNPEDVAWVRQQLADGNEWGWCQVKLVATWWDRNTGKAYEGVDHLGGCSYGSEEDFKHPGGYYDDMKSQAYDALISNIEAGREAEED